MGAQMLDQANGALQLVVDALQLACEVRNIGGTAFQAFQPVDHRQAHGGQRLVDFMHQPRCQFAQGGHLGCLQQLLLAMAHCRVVAGNCLDLHQLPVLIEQATLGPHPPGIAAPR